MNPRQIIDELQSLDLQQPGNWPRWAHYAAAVVLGIFAIGLGAYIMIKPDYEDLGREQAREGDLKREFESKQHKVAGLDAYRAQLEEMQHNFGDMLKQLPSKTEVANLLNDISQTRVASSLDEELFQPQGEVHKEFYAEIPNKIVVTGTYHEMGAFVSGVAALPRIVTIDEVELRPVGGNAPKDELRMTAYAKTYRYLDDSEQRAPAKGVKR